MKRRKPYRSPIKPRLCLFPEYNWCGPGCSGPQGPINAVDAACRAHDLCYRSKGPRCDCDVEFLERLDRLRELRSKEGEHARLIYSYMKLQTLFKCY
ncbi:phospholipase [Pontibacillus yanchengensis]|uniref:phospholipase n=1 Tax=Pontibacillus yanchengensis TaxID=462910 RepID=UPI001F3C5574|nr:phospholipase [Pontibacillus yanchengensis]